MRARDTAQWYYTTELNICKALVQASATPPHYYYAIVVGQRKLYNDIEII